jgi:hypothetical protein
VDELVATSLGAAQTIAELVRSNPAEADVRELLRVGGLIGGVFGLVGSLVGFVFGLVGGVFGFVRGALAVVGALGGFTAAPTSVESQAGEGGGGEE